MSEWLSVEWQLTSLNGSRRNSSVPTTCWKFCSAYLWDRVCSSLHEWASVNRTFQNQLISKVRDKRGFANNCLLPLRWKLSYGICVVEMISPTWSLRIECVSRNDWNNEECMRITPQRAGPKPKPQSISMRFHSSIRFLGNKTISTEFVW